MRKKSSVPSTVNDDGVSVRSHLSQETLLFGTRENHDDAAEISDSESSYETVIIRPARKEIVKQEEEIEVSDYVTDSEAEEEARIRRENRKKKKNMKASSNTKRASPAAAKRASAPTAAKKKPTKPVAAPEKPEKKRWFNFRNKDKKQDDEEEKADDEPANEPEPEPNKPVERMKHKPKDYYHGFSRDHCDAAKDMKREWKHKSKERMEARKKAMEASSDSESAHEKILKRVVTKVTIMKEVEVEIPAETIRRKKQKSFRTVKISNTRKNRAPEKDEGKEEVERVPANVEVVPSAKNDTFSAKRLVPVRELQNEEHDNHVVDMETGKKCYMWYARLGQPNKTQFVKRVQEMLDEGKVIDFKVKDVEALPWVAGGSMLSVSKMNKLFLQPEDLSDDE